MRKFYSIGRLALAGLFGIACSPALAECGYTATGPTGTMFVLEPDPDAPAPDLIVHLLPVLPDAAGKPRDSLQEPNPAAAALRDVSAAIIARRVAEAAPEGPALVRALDDARILAQVPDNRSAEILVTRRGQLAFHLVKAIRAVGAAAGPDQIVAPGATDGRIYILDREPVLTGADLIDSQPAYHPRTGDPVINFRFGPAGRDILADFTARNVGHHLAIVLDGEVLVAPRIMSPILGGAGFIEGRFSTDETRNTAIILRGASLPAPLRVIWRREVGPLHHNRALAGPALMIELTAPPPTDARAICRRLAPLWSADISVQSAGPSGSDWLLWVELLDGRTPAQILQAVTGAFEGSAEVSASYLLGPDLAAGAAQPGAGIPPAQKISFQPRI